MRNHFLRAAASILLVATLPAQSPCGSSWLGSTAPGTDGVVLSSVAWDPDGAGPASPVLVIGGNFTRAGGVFADRVATFDPASGSWSALGNGLSGNVWALTVLPTGQLLAAGEFVSSGSASVRGLAQWSGTSWIPLGGSLGNGYLRALLVAPGGDLIVGGDFTSIGGVAARRVARWNGTTWSPLGAGIGSATLNSGSVNALALYPNGDLAVGGRFSLAGGSLSAGLARWNGSNWVSLASSLGGSVPFGPQPSVEALLALPSGDLLVGGRFDQLDSWLPAKNLAIRTASGWSLPCSTMGTPAGLQFPLVANLRFDGTGAVIVGGAFTHVDGIPTNGIARWNGTAWSAIGSGDLGIVYTTSWWANGDLWAGGSFLNSGAVVARGLAAWDGSAWRATSNVVASVFDNWIWALATLPDGSLVAGGRFGSPGSTTGVARRSGGTWSSMPGLPSSSTVSSLATAENGDLIAGLNGVWRWNGVGWASLGQASPANAAVSAVLPLPGGDIVAAGSFTSLGGYSVARIARRNGSVWTQLGAIPDGFVNAVVRLANGDLVAGGTFTTAGAAGTAYLARWNGTSWTSLGGSFNGPVDCLAVLPNGDLVAGGQFGVPALGLARWNGVGWSALGTGLNGIVRSLAVHPNGDLLASGSFWLAGGQFALHFASWDGTSWAGFAEGLSDIAHAFAFPGEGTVAVGGRFQMSGSNYSPYFAELAPSCPPAIAATGAGCAGSGGPNVMTATTPPWAGGSFEVRTTGLAANSIAIAVCGFSALAVPLPAILPEGVAGCMLHAAPDLFSAHIAVGGQVTVSLPLPAVAALAGQQLHRQVVAFELDLAGTITAFTSSNALVATIGVF